MRQQRDKPRAKGAATDSKGAKGKPKGKPKGKSRVGCIVALVILLAVAALALNEFGIVSIPFLPKFLNLSKDKKADAEADAVEGEVAVEGETGDEAAPEDASEEVVEEEQMPPKRPAAPVASASAATQRKAAEEKSRKDAANRLQRVAEIVAELDPETAVETLQSMTLEEQVSILRVLEDKAVTDIVAAMEKDDRVDVLQGLKQPPGTRLGSRTTSSSSPQSGDQARRSLLSLPFRPRSGTN